MSFHDEQHQAEQFDDEVLGRRPGPGRPLTPPDYPPEQPLGVEDPLLLEDGTQAEDDLVIRDWRHGDPGGTDAGTRLVPVEDGDPAGDDPLSDTEATAIAADAVDVPDPAAEEAALHVIDPPDEG